MLKKSVFVSSKRESLSLRWYGLFNLNCQDLYPEDYSLERCYELAELALEIMALAEEKKSKIMVHYYLPPEFHEVADMLGDSLALSRFVQETRPPRADFQAVFFMAATAKIIAGDSSRIFVSDTPEALGCSLVFGTDHVWVENWKKQNPDGLLVTYINSDVRLKAMSDFISTSRNTDKIIAYAAKNFPGREILVLPDKFLGFVMKVRALEILEKEGIKVDPDLIEIYQQPFGGFNACCYVHEQLGPDAIDVAMIENPEAEIMIHPECGCASSCMYRISQGEIPHQKAFFLSTEQMIQRAKESPLGSFIVATEPGLVYALRRRLPKKKFIPVSAQAHCRYMKGNTFEKLLKSLREDRLEVCLSETSFQNEKEIHIAKSEAQKARLGIERMLSIV